MLYLHNVFSWTGTQIGNIANTEGNDADSENPINARINKANVYDERQATGTNKVKIDGNKTENPKIHLAPYCWTKREAGI